MKVGVVLPVARESDDGGDAPTWPLILELARTAEDVGLDSLWVADHLFYEPDDGPALGFWESSTLLSALAASTHRVTVGSLVLCTPFRNPALIARMAATLDEVSAGRAVLGLGCGW